MALLSSTPRIVRFELAIQISCDERVGDLQEITFRAVALLYHVALYPLS